MKPQRPKPIAKEASDPKKKESPEFRIRPMYRSDLRKKYHFGRKFFDARLKEAGIDIGDRRILTTHEVEQFINFVGLPES